jgi:hypothetical protein
MITTARWEMVANSCAIVGSATIDQLVSNTVMSADHADEEDAMLVVERERHSAAARQFGTSAPW